DGTLQEWIFDKSSYAVLGQRSVMLHDSSVGKAGTVVYIDAVLERAVVNHAGETPRKTTD
ncbi:hypothetical protein AB0C64_44485, partial [Streptomyces sp900116325]